MLRGRRAVGIAAAALATVLAVAWTRRRTDLAGRGYAAVHGMSFADATSGWLLSASLTGCGPACDSEGAVLATRSAGRTWTPVLPGR
jgi:photosystem II stability/assembly factor-like uncharacterized protein